MDDYYIIICINPAYYVFCIVFSLEETFRFTEEHEELSKVDLDLQKLQELDILG